MRKFSKPEISGGVQLRDTGAFVSFIHFLTPRKYVTYEFLTKGNQFKIPADINHLLVFKGHILSAE